MDDGNKVGSSCDVARKGTGTGAWIYSSRSKAIGQRVPRYNQYKHILGIRQSRQRERNPGLYTWNIFHIKHLERNTGQETAHDILKGIQRMSFSAFSTLDSTLVCYCFSVKSSQQGHVLISRSSADEDAFEVAEPFELVRPGSGESGSLGYRNWSLYPNLASHLVLCSWGP